MSKKQIVIVGAGFAGMQTALKLAGDEHVAVILINDHPDFRYYPSLYRTATGGRRILSSIPIREILADKDVTFIQDNVIDLDRKAQTVTTSSKQVIRYNALVLALGVRTNYFGIKGLKDFSYGVKTPDDAERLKQHLHQQMIDDNRLDLNYVVIGGGPTGLELAGFLPTYLEKVAQQHGIPHKRIHVDLVEAAPRLVPRMPKDMSRAVARHLRRLGVKLYLGKVVQAQTADALMVNNKRISSHTVIWTAGVANSSFFADHDFQLADNGRVRVDQFLQAERGIYVIGDNADTPFSGMAQTAIYDGKFVANNLKRIARNEDPEPYVAKRPVYVFPAGPNWAAVLWGKFRLNGWLGWRLRRASDLIGYHDFEPWQQASRRWAQEDNSEESCPICSV